MAKTTSYANALLGAKRGTALSWPTNIYVGLMTAGKGPRSALNSQSVALNDYVCLIPNGGSRMSLYKVTTAGSLAAAQASLYPGVANEVITDGGAVLTEQTSALQAMTGASMAVAGEPTIGTGAYARIALVSNTTNWGAPASGVILNASTGWAFPQATAAWTSGLAAAWGVFLADVASGAGGIWEWYGFTASIQIPQNATVSISAGQLSVTEL